ncbi:cytochrome P450 [Artemisia annua]|uniref:Cytochrome P450 n=1 Tax=Artemisia annua TaxID=35608 RepID=A0A2U1P6Y2_ARTAN|nr:cytochrome P450 [Artemisia annua]
MVSLNDVTYVIRIRELCSWTPTFVGDDSGSEEEGFMGRFDQDEEKVLEPEIQETINKVFHDVEGANEEPIDSDPLGLAQLINRKRDKTTETKCSETPKFPPGYASIPKETIKVGTGLGLNMECCKNTLASLVAGNGEFIVDLWMLRQVWGNTYFDFASTSARGKLGGIICKWNSLLIGMMGDFNDVHDAGERFGSVFNERQAEIFNEFITNASLIDILLAGVFLEKGIPDHRPILLKESMADYSPTHFRFFHSWLAMEGFHNLVVDTWNNDGIVEANGFISFKKKLQNLKKIDQGCASEEDFLNRNDSITFLGEIDRLEAKDIARKSKIKLAIEGAAELVVARCHTLWSSPWFVVKELLVCTTS